MHIGSSTPARFDPSGIRLPLIALIDVVLFLLFYFVISYSISAEEAELSTGFARAGQSETAIEPQVVLVTQAGDRIEYRIGLRMFTDRDSLIDLLRKLPKETGVVVKATPDTPVWATVGAVQASKDAGFDIVRFAISGTSDGVPP